MRVGKITWFNRMQETFPLILIEEEYRVASFSNSEAIWFDNLTIEVTDHMLEMMVMNCNNHS